MDKRNLFIFIVTIFLTHCVIGQKNSFQKSYDPANQKYFLFQDIMVNEKDEAFGVIQGPTCGTCTHYFLVPFEDSDIIKPIRIDISPKLFTFSPKTLFYGSKVIVQYPCCYGVHIFWMDMKDHSAWVKQFWRAIPNFPIILRFSSFTQSVYNEILTTASLGAGTINKERPDSLYLFNLKESGELLWKRVFVPKIPNKDTVIVHQGDLGWDALNGNFYFSTQLATGGAPNTILQALIKFAPNGDPIL